MLPPAVNLGGRRRRRFGRRGRIIGAIAYGLRAGRALSSPAIDLGETREWRFGWPSRIFGTIVFGGWTIGAPAALAVAAVSSGWAAALAALPLAAPMAAGVFLLLYLWRSRMVAAPGGITIYKIRSVIVVPWSNVGTCWIGKAGLWITSPSGAHVASSNVPQGGLRRRKARICGYLEERAARVRIGVDAAPISAPTFRQPAYASTAAVSRTLRPSTPKP